MYGDIRNERLDAKLNAVIELAVVEAERQLLLQLFPAREQIIPAYDPDRASAAHVEEPLNRARIDVGIAGNEIERAVQVVERDAIAHAVDLDPARIGR